MPLRKLARIEPTDDWPYLQLQFEWPEQEAYEVVRPVVLFGFTPAERAQQTGISASTIYRRATRFEQLGIRPAQLHRVGEPVGLRCVPAVDIVVAAPSLTGCSGTPEAPAPVSPQTSSRYLRACAAPHGGERSGRRQAIARSAMAFWMSARRYGFATAALMPWSRASSGVICEPYPDAMMMRISGYRARTWRASSQPSMLGMPRLEITRSKCSTPRRSSAASLCPAGTTPPVGASSHGGAPLAWPFRGTRRSLRLRLCFVGCLVVALVLLGVPAVLYLTGRGYMVRGTFLAGAAGLFNAWLWFRARPLVAYTVYGSSLAEHRPISLLSLIGTVLGGLMAFTLWTALLGWEPIFAVLRDWSWQLWATQSWPELWGSSSLSLTLLWPTEGSV
jgi:hypothetical protein